jgi:hypothetical protein
LANTFNYPGGMCTITDCLTTSCPAASAVGTSVCLFVPVVAGEQAPLCFAAGCTPSSANPGVQGTCRPGYSCVSVNGVGGTCIPDPFFTAQPDVVATLHAPCTLDSECRAPVPGAPAAGGFCRTDLLRAPDGGVVLGADGGALRSGNPGGQCSRLCFSGSDCSTTGADAPLDGLCLPGAASFYGECARGCAAPRQGQSTCRPGYVCEQPAELLGGPAASTGVCIGRCDAPGASCGLGPSGRPKVCRPDGYCAEPADAGVGADAGVVPLDGGSGETCPTAVTLVPPVVVAGTTAGAVNDFSVFASGCQRFGLAPDRVFRVTVPAAQRLVVEAATVFDSTVNLIADLANCGTSLTDGGVTGLQCVAGRDQPDDAPVVWDNTGTTARDVFVVIDGWSTGSGAFTLGARLTPIPSGDRCASAEPLPVGASLSQTLEGYVSDSYGSCVSAAGPERFYSATIPPNSRLTVDVTSVGVDGGTPFRPAVNFSTTSCTFGSCLFGGLAPVGSNRVVVSHDNLSASPLPVLVAIDTTSTAGGPFTLVSTLASVAPPAGDLCSSAPAAPAGVTPSTFSGFSNHYDTFSSFSTCGYAPGPDRAWTVAVPAGRVLTARAASPTADVTLSLASSTLECGSTSCLRSANQTTTGAEVVTFSNQDPDAGVLNVVLVVDSAATTAPGASFNLDVSTAPPAPNDNCFASGPPITGPVSLSAQTTSGFTDTYQGRCAFRSGPDRVWAIEVPQNSQLIATVTGADVSLSLLGSLADCASETAGCFASTDSFGQTEVLTWTNRGEARVVSLVVEAAASASFSLSVAFVPVTPPAGDTCFNAGAPIASSVTLPGQSLSGYGDDYRWSGSGCAGFGLNGPDRAYAVVVPAGQRLRATVTGAGFDATLNLTTACPLFTGATCLAGANAQGAGGAETLTWTNTGAGSATVFLVVDTWMSTPGPFDLSIVLEAALGETCTTPEVIVPPATLTNQTTVGFSNDVSCGSAFSQPGFDRVYSVTVPAGQLLTAVMTPASFDGALVIIDGPASACQAMGSVCQGVSDNIGSSAVENLSWRNTSASPRTVFVIVDSFSVFTAGAFSLSINTQP